MAITADSIPVYNYSYLANVFSPSGAAGAIFTDSVRKVPVWECADWIAYFEALRSKYGEAKAKEIWSYFWNLGVSKGAGGAGDLRAGSGMAYDSVPLDCRTTNSDFRKFIDKYKLNDTVYKGLGVIAKPLGVGADVVVAATNVVEGAAGAASSIGKIIKYGVPLLLITVAGIVVYKIYKSKAI